MSDWNNPILVNKPEILEWLITNMKTAIDGVICGRHPFVSDDDFIEHLCRMERMYIKEATSNNPLANDGQTGSFDDVAKLILHKNRELYDRLAK